MDDNCRTIRLNVRLEQDWIVYHPELNSDFSNLDDLRIMWIGEKLPKFKVEDRFVSNWIKSNGNGSINYLVLQACYVDRFGNSSPFFPQNKKNRYSTYKFSNGEFLYDDQYDMVNSNISRQSKDSKALPIGFNPTSLQWISSIRHYEKCFKINSLKLNYLAAKVKRTGNLCIFLSSPFDGYAEERERFMLKFPTLSRLCQDKGVFLSVVDMRWGISDQLGKEHKTVTTCLSSIDKSDIFIGYFAARYGSCVLTKKEWVKEDVAEALKKPQFEYITQYSDRSVTEMEFQHAFAHSNFYERCDKPISFVLYRDPKYDSQKYLAYKESAEKCKEDKNTAEKCKEDKNTAEKCTEDKNTAEKCTEDKNTAEKYEYEASFYKEEEGCSELKARLKSAVERIASMPEAYLSLFDNYIDPEMGSNLMLSCCNSLIKNVLQRLLPPANYSSVYQAHLSFARSRIAIYVPFATAAATYAKQYVTLEAGRDCNLLIIAGESGSGKSSLMADLIFNSGLDMKLCVFHFIGCTTESTYLPHMLRRIYDELCTIIKTYLPVSMEFPHVDELNLNNIFDPIIQIYSREDGLPKKLPVIVIVIDALNQLVDEPYSDDYADLPSNFLWIPEKLPDKLRLVVSCIDVAAMATRFSIGDMTPTAIHAHEKTIPTLLSRCPTAEVIDIPSMTSDQIRDLSTEYLNKYCKEFNDDKIMTELCNASQCTNPMFLSIALDYLVRHASWSYFKQKGCSEVLEFQTVPQLLESSIEKIEQTDAELSHIMELILCFIYCSRIGLTSQELIDLVNMREQPTVNLESSQFVLNQTTWYRMEIVLSLLITARGGFFNITHDYIRQAIEKRYFGKDKTIALLEKEATANDEPSKKILIEARSKMKLFHQKLSKFFQLQSYGGKALSDRQTIEEIQYHQKKGGIRPTILVGVRICPMDSNNPDYYEQMKSCVVTEGCRLTLCNWEHDQISGMQSFNFDFILNSSDKSRVNSYASQEKVFRTLNDVLVTEALNGENVTMLAYGQTGSGKSYTMFGKSNDDPTQRGLIPRMMEDLLKRLNEKKMSDGWHWSAKCTMVEIYKNNAYDLLRGVSIGRMERKDKSKISISCYRQTQINDCSRDNEKDTTVQIVRSSKTVAVETVWEGALYKDVCTSEDILRILESGLMARETKATAMNDVSSRSHCIFTIYVEQKHEISKEELKSKVHLVDLAGSERLKKTGVDLFHETRSNNESLSALNACLQALSCPNVTYVPYRASTLTWFLQDSLGGKATTVFLATISPSINNINETRQTLHYATFAQKIAVSKEEALKLKEELERIQPQADQVSIKLRIY